MSSTVEQVGRVIGGRYRLLAVVGAGASAQVFAADDTRLGRRVAVKLLHPALAGDATFLRKFQAEARLAASLNHRNVLHVYDWGDEDGIPYLVLEFLGGGSLRSLLDTGRLLSPQQAAAVGAEAAHGLAYAHRRGLVHRDIKPANLLFDDDGRLLVADFGLARALAEAAITEPLGTVMGTARYASPEQVEGRPVDDRTDVYSLALTLYESVTGRVPFAGDTTVATLMARVGAVLPAARELGPLAPVLAQAAISEPLARLDAAALAFELETLLLELDTPEPLPLNRADLALPNLPFGLDRDPTERFGLAGSSPAPAAPQALPSQASPSAPVQASRLVPPPPLPETAEPQVAIQVTRSSATSLPTAVPGVRRIMPAPAAVLPEPSRSSRRRHRWLPWLLAVLLLELVAGAGVVVASRLVWHHATVPRVVGMQVTAADAILRRTGLTPEVSGAFYSGRVARGGVISQLPRSGAREKTASIVKMVISEGRHPASLPSLAGMTEAMAGTAVRRAHLVPQFLEQYSETVAFGAVVSSNAPAGSRVFYGDTVDVVISKGPEPQLIPADLSGGVLTSAQADSILTDLHLRPVDDQEYSNSVPLGYVVTTKPASGQTVPGHSTVQVFVSAGPPFVTVPSLYADSAAVAEQTLGSLGLQWSLYGPPSADFVLSQLPAAGTSARVGSTVTLYLY
ncbi:MAG: PASTA domain-containing protein [Acidimicrobiales bacterium]|jgi:serine/threonine-protein kinase